MKFLGVGELGVLVYPLSHRYAIQCHSYINDDSLLRGSHYCFFHDSRGVRLNLYGEELTEFAFVG